MTPHQLRWGTPVWRVARVYGTYALDMVESENAVSPIARRRDSPRCAGGPAGVLHAIRVTMVTGSSCLLRDRRVRPC